MNTKRKVFVSFRFCDGIQVKDKLIEFLEEQDLIIDKSEDEDRQQMSDETIQSYLFEKLKDSSITIVLLTPEAIRYRRGIYNSIDDWMYDELRYSLYNRADNPINGVIALYTPQAGNMIISKSTHKCDKCNTTKNVQTILDFDNLVKDNMMNVKRTYKKNSCNDLFDSDYDSYISLVKLEEFYNNPSRYIDIATEKRRNSNRYIIKVRKE